MITEPRTGKFESAAALHTCKKTLHKERDENESMANQECRIACVHVDVFALTLGAQDANAEKAVTYLTEEQDEKGFWNRDERKRMVDTLESFQALQRVNGGEKALNEALKYFLTLPEETNETLAVKLQALSSSTADVTALADKLISLQKADGGWGLVESKRGSVPHTLLAVNALLSSKKASAETLNDAC